MSAFKSIVELIYNCIRRLYSSFYICARCLTAMEIIGDASGVCCDVDFLFQLVFAVYSSSMSSSGIYMLSLSSTNDHCNESYCELKADSQSLLK